MSELIHLKSFALKSNWWQLILTCWDRCVSQWTVPGHSWGPHRVRFAPPPHPLLCHSAHGCACWSCTADQSCTRDTDPKQSGPPYSIHIKHDIIQPLISCWSSDALSASPVCPSHSCYQFLIFHWSLLWWSEIYKQKKSSLNIYIYTI